MLNVGDEVEFTLDGERTVVTLCSETGRYVRVQGAKGWIPVTDLRAVAMPAEIADEKGTEP
jgi:hypothetical protein